MKRSARIRKRSKAARLHMQEICNTLCDMRHAVTIRLDQDLERTLDKFCRRSKRKRSDVVRDALRRQLALMTFEQLRHKAMPFAEARGFLTDEDVFKAVS
jgi:predicted transcriptional regulator